jgi:hypothetical protein
MIDCGAIGADAIRSYASQRNRLRFPRDTQERGFTRSPRCTDKTIINKHPSCNFITALLVAKARWLRSRLHAHSLSVAAWGCKQKTREFVNNIRYTIGI